MVARVPVPLPPRPALVACPEKPLIESKIVDVEGVGQHVMMSMADALKLRNYLYALMICALENELTLKGHVEKLENRIKALGGD